MDKKLEEAIKTLKVTKNVTNNYRIQEAIETVLQALDNSISTEEYNKIKEENEMLREYIIVATNLDEMTATRYAEIQKEGYFKGRAEGQQKAEQIISNNYISKQLIKEEIKELERELKEIEKLQFNDYYEYIQTSTQTKIICLQSIIIKYKELLERK